MRRPDRLTPIAVALCLGVLAGDAWAQDWSKVRIATEGAYPPWNATDSSGELVGFEVDLAKELCQRMNAECEIVAQDWEGIIPALQAGKYDAIMAGMSITDERQQVIDFTQSYWTTPAYFAVLKDSELAKADLPQDTLDLSSVEPDEQAAIDALKETLDGKAVGVQVATIHANFLENELGDVVEVRKYDTQENLDLDLQAGRIDAALADMSYWKPLLETEKGQDFTLIGPGLAKGPFGKGVGVGVRKENEDLRAMFDKAIEEVREDGTLSKLGQKWFGFDAST
ncbi:MAG TPA: lysine/arginine/ornithine ABC transporter substrate-binding protein [Geminicoccaceae bacterium]|nr:lysine/arginine/ornithine ABC transporter substrate-binding protein [Geminicoccaceae bacterium]